MSEIDVHVLRRRNLIALLQKFRAQGKGHTDTKFSETYGLNFKTLSQIKNADRDMGPSLARRIEDKLNLKPGWMDRDHENAPSDEAMEIARLWDKLPADEQTALKTYITMKLKLIDMMNQAAGQEGIPGVIPE